MKAYLCEDFEIQYQSGLEELVKKSVEIYNSRIEYVQKLFNCSSKEVGKIKVSFFTNRDDFVNYIKTVSNGQTPPNWATGCFYNGEIQQLVEEKNETEILVRAHTLLHETIHLYIQKTIYEKYGIERIIWFDESLAGFLDGHIENRSKSNLEKIVKNLIAISKNFDINILNDWDKMFTEEYNAYEIFMFVGKYIVENNLDKKYIELIKTDPSKIKEIGKTILHPAIEYAKINLGKE